ncbi:hypothetical protein [Streptomyces noursei]|uniref:hypothetical protein n=1 Tax=Streptomyces noursei TaxID=1971 RepID=UPI0013520FCB
MPSHDMQPLSRWAYYCEEHGVTVVFHDDGSSASQARQHPVSQSAGSGPVYVAKGRGMRYHAIPTCYTLGRINPAPVVAVVSLSKAERDGKTPCLHCVPKS